MPFAISEEQLTNYATILSKEFNVFKSEEIKDGIYLTSKTFFDSEPLLGYELVKNKKNEVVRAKMGEERLAAHKMFAYVENGKAYRYTPSGFLEMQKDDDGLYIISNYGSLFPVQTNSTYGMFGLLGVTADIIVSSSQNKKLQKEEKYKIYIDSLTGDYIIK